MSVQIELPEGKTARALIFSNSATHEGRTEALEAWPGIHNGQPGTVWTLLRKSRDHHDDVWGPPVDRGLFFGDMSSLTQQAQDEGYVYVELVE